MEFGQGVLELIELLVEYGRGSSLARPGHADLATIRLIKVDLNLRGVLERRQLLLVQAPGEHFRHGVGNPPLVRARIVCRIFVVDLLDQASEHLLGWEVREDARVRVFACCVGFQGRADDFGICSLLLGEAAADEDVFTDGDCASAGGPLAFVLDLHFFGVWSLDLDSTLSEVLGDLLWCGALALHPGMADDVCHEWALLRIEVDHGGDEVLEVVRIEIRVIGMVLLPRFPEQVGTVLNDELVERILLARHLVEWLMLAAHAEKNDSEGEQVTGLALVLVVVENLWGHVHWGADFRRVEACSLSSGDVGCKTEVDDFHVEVLVQENVLWLQVSVGQALRVEVVDPVDHLLHEVPADRLAECSGAVDVLVKLTAHDRFLDQVGHGFVLLTVHSLHNRRFCELMVLDDVRVVESHGCLDFCLEILDSLCVVLGLLEVKDFDCILLTVIRVAKLDLGAEALAKGLRQVVLVKCSLHRV